MPPKRGSTGSTGGNAPKKARKSAESTAAALPQITRSKRWAKVSNSGNLDDEFKRFLAKQGDGAYEFKCTCSCPYAQGRDDDDDEDEKSSEDDEDEDEDEEDDSDEDSVDGCDNGKTCICHKPAAEHPEAVWKFTVSTTPLPPLAQCAELTIYH
jgi:hypothetical protein